ncbi:MAG: 50S ribosomal protein L29 [Alphaproteobacteria bacterium]|jgi:large subunit ribosomal protein L29|nr:50S ribosomal protein L29 [Alphaproteobacteria bacterium]
MKAEELKGKTADELVKMLMDLRKTQFNLRFQKTAGQLENMSQIRVVRRDIARIKTFLTKTAQGVSAVASKAKAKAKKVA